MNLDFVEFEDIDNYNKTGIIPSKYTYEQFKSLITDHMCMKVIKTNLKDALDEYVQLISTDTKKLHYETDRFGLLHRKFINADFGKLVKYPDYANEKVFSEIENPDTIRLYLENTLIRNLDLIKEDGTNIAYIMNMAYIINRLPDGADKSKYIKILIHLRDYLYHNKKIYRDINSIIFNKS